ncbi:MAG: iron-sulfur cluster assembly accessory protein [Candidatus Latescibacterota bacterium]|nr:MAG: iron-sulfur cluster assembly accessory protein [Candidatus Latescibacterota bacterium]
MVIVTEDAARAIRSAMENEGLAAEDTYLRVAVKGGGCSGLSYELEFTEEKQVGDVEVEKNGVRVLVDLKSQIYLAGTTLDYSSGLNGKGFVFVNPNATGTCGCGESFSA